MATKHDLSQSDTGHLSQTMNSAGSNQLMEQTSFASSLEKRPLITFALFAYNQEDLVKEAVEGALSQTYSPLEIILSDDCSIDRTFEVMKEMANAYKGPHQVKVRRQPVNDGLLNHVCAVVSEMSGEIMVLAAGDDVSVSQRVETIVAAWTPSCIGLFSACDLISKDGKILEKNWLPTAGARDRLPWLKEIRSDLFVYGASSCYHRSILEELPLSVSKVYSEDTPLNLLLQLNSGDIQICPEALVKYRVHRNSISSSNLPSKPSFDTIMREEKSHAKHIRIQRDILVYLHEIFVPSAKAEELVDMSAILSEIAFCDLRHDWYYSSLFQRVITLLNMTRKGWLWTFPRIFGLNFYVALKYLLTCLRLKKNQRQGIKS